MNLFEQTIILRKPGEDAGARVENEVGAHDSGDGAAGADDGDTGICIQQNVRDGRGQSAEEVEDEIAEVAKVVFDVVAEDPEEKHVATDVPVGSVQEHGSEDGQNGGGDRVVGMAGKDGEGVAGNEAELKCKGLKSARVEADGNFPGEDEDIEGDQKIADEGSGEAGLIVAKGNHLIGNWRFVIGNLRAAARDCA